MVLQGPGDDLGRRRRAPVDQHHNGHAFGHVAGTGVEALRVLGPAGARGNDLALVQKHIRDGHGLIQQAARVVAQIEHDALQFVADFLLELGHHLLHALLRLFVEGGHAQVADLPFQARAHGTDLDNGAGDGDVERRAPGTADGQTDVGTDAAAHLVDRFGEGQPEHRLAVQMADQVAGLDTGAERRGVVDGRNHLDQSGLHGDLDSQAPELAAGLHLHLAEAFGVQVAGMGIQRGQHAGDGGLYQILVAGLLDVIGAHALEDIPEKVEKPVGIRAVFARFCRIGPGQNQKGDHGGHQKHSSFHPLTLPLRAASQGKGLIG